MRRLLRVAAHLYPGPWRERYGSEFDLLLDEAGPSLRQFANVLQGAIFMHINARSFASITVFCALIGVAVAAVIAFRIQDQYVSTAVLRIKSPEDRDIRTEVAVASAKLLTRQTLAGVIATLGLYPEARSEKPLEDVIEDMGRSIKLVPVSKPLSAPDAFLIWYSSSDGSRAQAVARELTNLFIGERALLPDAEVVDEANSPKGPIYPKRGNVITLGLGAGLMIGLLTASFRRWHMGRYMRRTAVAAFPQ